MSLGPTANGTAGYQALSSGFQPYSMRSINSVSFHMERIGSLRWLFETEPILHSFSPSQSHQGATLRVRGSMNWHERRKRPREVRHIVAADNLELSVLDRVLQRDERLRSWAVRH